MIKLLGFVKSTILIVQYLAKLYRAFIFLELNIKVFLDYLILSNFYNTRNVANDFPLL